MSQYGRRTKNKTQHTTALELFHLSTLDEDIDVKIRSVRRAGLDSLQLFAKDQLCCLNELFGQKTTLIKVFEMNLLEITNIAFSWSSYSHFSVRLERGAVRSTWLNSRRTNYLTTFNRQII
jgi:hypothetical protein